MNQTYSAKPEMTEHRKSDQPKTRECLNCRKSFHSEWSGERVCSKCKSKSSWRRA